MGEHGVRVVEFSADNALLAAVFFAVGFHFGCFSGGDGGTGTCVQFSKLKTQNQTQDKAKKKRNLLC